MAQRTANGRIRLDDISLSVVNLAAHLHILKCCNNVRRLRLTGHDEGVVATRGQQINPFFGVREAVDQSGRALRVTVTNTRRVIVFPYDAIDRGLHTKIGGLVFANAQTEVI